MPADLRFIDLFAGAGGLSAGFGGVPGFRPVAAVERDLAAAATYSVNHPGVPVFAGDIADWLEGSPPAADLVLGGPPCQGFSSLGTRNSRDPRNALWRRYLETLETVRPLYFVLENVGNFLKSGQFAALTREARPSGRLNQYRIEPFLLNAADYGVPQVRKRAVLIGSRLDLPAPGAPPTTRRNPSGYATVGGAIGDLPLETDAVELPDARFQFHDVSLPGPFKTVELHLGRRVSALSLLRYAAIPKNGNRRHLPEHLQAECWKRHRTGAGDVMGRLDAQKPSVTIRTEFWKPEKGRYLHPVANRPLTLHEGARLQGFPDDYMWCGSKTEIGRQIGNAVPIGLSRALAAHLARQIAR